jgi:hypothetical protein
VTVRREVYEELKRLADAHGLDVPDFLALVARTYNLVETLSKLVSQLGESQHATGKPPEAPKEPPGSAPGGRKGGQRKAWEILREQGVVCASAMRARDPHKVIDVLRDGGAIVIASESDRCAVYPDTWMSFVEALAKAGSPDEREVAGRLRGRAKQLFKMLRAAGAVHYDSKTKTWVVDTSIIERGESPGLEEIGVEEGEGGRAVKAVAEEGGEAYEWCRDKSGIGSLQGFLKWVDGRFGLLDWWDEGDRYCFKTRGRPAGQS